MIARLMRAGRGRRVLAAGVMAIAFASLGTRAAPVLAQTTPTLWGIDSCSSAQSVVPGTQSILGNPQFMARYLGTANPCAMNASEVAYLSSDNLYIMLIYSPDQNFTAGTGTPEAQAAIALAEGLGAPPGTAIFRDVEAGSPITTQYIEDWYQAFRSSTSGYVPGFYENPNGGSNQPFNSQYCSAVQNNSLIGSAPLWSSSPEKQSYTPYESQAPAWSGSGFPGTPSCANNTVAWQYLEKGVNSGSWPGNAPNVDVDEFNAADQGLLWNGPKGPDAYTPLTPFRVCDTRPGNTTACTGHTLDQGGDLAVQIAGVAGPSGQSVPAAAQSVVLNVTAIFGTIGTLLTVYPTGSALPNTSNVNVDAQTNQANLVVVTLGAGGQVSVYNPLGDIDVAMDVEGYFAPPSGSSSVPGLFHPISPLRLCDTRAGTGTACSGTTADNLLGAGQWTKVVVSGCPTGDASCAASVPTSDVEAVALNLTAVSGTSFTYLSVVPPNSSDQCPTGTPGFSNLNVSAESNLPNRVIVPVGPDQDVCVYNSLGTINYILDVNGWFGNGSESTPGAYFYGISPLRLCDTRSAASIGYTTECSGKTLGPGGTLTVPVGGMDGLPAEGGPSPPVAVIANVTAVSGTSFTYFTLYPADATLPTASDLNAGAQQNVANLGIVQLATTGPNAGAIDIYNSLGTINAIVDVAGWFQ